MAFRKFKAQFLFDGYEMRSRDQVLVIADNDTIEAIVPVHDAGDDVQSFEGILCPGFINCHCHLELSHMKGMLEERTGLIQFVLQVVQRRHHPEEHILQAIAAAEDEMIANGIVAVGDICNNALTLPQKKRGRLFYHNFIEAAGLDPAKARERFQRSLGFFREYGEHYSIPVESNSIVPHAPYSVAKELWEMIVNFPGNHLLSIHNQETEDENDWFLDKKGELLQLYKQMNVDPSFFVPSGKTSLQTYLPNFLRNQSVILVHNVFTSEEDILFSRSAAVNCAVYWCFCPNANQYISGCLPPIDRFAKESNIVLGTDSLASNHQLSILAEMKTIKENDPSITDATLLRWATSNGAKALQMDNLLGSFEKNKTPGILLLTPDFASCRRLA